MVSPQPDRLTAVLADAESVGREGLARHLAANTAMSLEQIVATLRCSARQGDAAGIAAASAATTARALLGLPADHAADEAIGQQIAEAHRNEAAVHAHADAEAARFATEFAEGQESARRLLGRRH